MIRACILSFLLLIRLCFSDSSLTGRVTNQNGVAVAHAVVTVGNWHERGADAVCSVKTNALGRFFIDNLKPGMQSLRIECEEYMVYEDCIKLSDGLNRGDYTIQSIMGSLSGYASRTFTFSGTVMDRDTQKPISNAAVTVLGRSTFSGKTGTFSISDLHGEVIFLVSAEGYTQLKEKHAVSRNVKRHVFYLKPQETFCTVGGIVVEKESGHRIGGARILFGKRMATSDSSGYYELMNMKPGKSAVKVYHDDYSDYSGTVTLRGGKNVYDILLSLNQSEGILTGIVLDYATGTPIQSAKVVVGKKISITDQAGKYSISGLKFGKNNLIVLVNGKTVYKSVISYSGSVSVYDILVKE